MTVLDPRMWLAAAGALAIAYGGGRWQQHASDATAHKLQTEAAATAAAQAQTAAVAAARAEEQRRAAAQADIATKAQKEAENARNDAATANDAADRLRKRVDDLLAAARAPKNSIAAGASAPASDPLGMLADVLERADRRAGVLAAYADQAHIAGRACEAAYDSLTAPAAASVPAARADMQ